MVPAALSLILGLLVLRKYVGARPSGVATATALADEV